MGDTFELNRLEFDILKCLYDGGCTDQYHSMSITELLNANEKLVARMTIYKKLDKLVKAKYVKKGIVDNHADTFYLLDKTIRIFESKEPDISNQQMKNSKCISSDSNSVRDKLIEIANQGLMLKAIALNVGIDVNDLSRFKGGMECLKQSDVEILSEYLNEVVIPVWNSVTKQPNKKKSNRDLLFL